MDPQQEQRLRAEVKRVEADIEALIYEMNKNLMHFRQRGVALHNQLDELSVLGIPTEEPVKRLLAEVFHIHT